MIAARDSGQEWRIERVEESTGVWSSPWRAGGIILALCLILFLPGLWTIPPVDRDESRFAQASRQMVESGDYILPRVQDKPRLNKPPLIYWLQSASIKAFGDREGQNANGNIWVFRLPSVLCAIASVLLTWRLGSRMFGPRVGMLAGALIAACPMVIWDAHQARADQLLLLTIIAMQFALFAVWRGSVGLGGTCVPPVLERLLYPIFFWTALAASLMAKGPVGLMIAALTILTICIVTRSWKWTLRLQPVLGIIILAALVGPWVYAVGERVGWAEYIAIIQKETLGRSTEAAEGHWGPPGYHLVLLCVLFWPGVLLTGAAVVRGFRMARIDRASPELFLLAWALPAWIAFELISTKLPHYTMPLYPALAILSARAVLEFGRTMVQNLGDRLGFAVWGIIGLAGLCGTLIAVAKLGGAQIGLPGWILVGGLTPLLIGALVIKGWWATRRNDMMRAQVLGVLALAGWSVVFLGVVLPQSGRIWISPRLMEAFRAVDHDRIGLVGFHEDSMIFLSRGRADRLGVESLGEWLNANGHTVVAIQQPLGDKLDAATRSRLEPLTRITGFNYSVGKEVTIDLYRKAAP